MVLAYLSLVMILVYFSDPFLSYKAPRYDARDTAASIYK